MLYKWLGGGMIVAATSLAGFLQAQRLERRVSSLMRLKTALSVLESEIAFSAHDLKTAFFRIEKIVGAGGIFQDAGEGIASLGVQESWHQAVDNRKKTLFLSEQDADALKTLAAELGMTDRDNQIKNIRRVAALLSTAAEQAQMEYDRTARLYRSGGVMAGLLFVILLF